MPPPYPTVGSEPRSRRPCRAGSARSWAWHTAPSIPEFRLHLQLGVGLVTASSRASREGLVQAGRVRPGRGLGPAQREPGVQAVLLLFTGAEMGGGLEVWAVDQVT